MISVCMATYNGEKNIKEQLSSILVQLEINDEIIISDDNSNDMTLNIINGFNDKRIKIFTNKGRGVIKNFENAIQQSSGDIIFLSDQDDIWDNDKVKICMKDFNEGYDLILSDCVLFDSDTSQIIMDSHFNLINAKKGVIRNIVKNSYMGCCMAFNNKVKNKVIPFPSNIPMHDSWIGIISEIYFNVKYNNEKLVRHRRHDQNASQTGAAKSSSPFFKKIKSRVLLAFNIAVFVLKNRIN